MANVYFGKGKQKMYMACIAQYKIKSYFHYGLLTKSKLGDQLKNLEVVYFQGAELFRNYSIPQGRPGNFWSTS